jgi:hypothetical protein
VNRVKVVVFCSSVLAFVKEDKVNIGEIVVLSADGLRVLKWEAKAHALLFICTFHDISATAVHDCLFMTRNCFRD